MAALLDFQQSSQRHWLRTKEQMLACQAADRARGLTEAHIQQLKGYFTQYVYDLANSIKLRQRVAATAVVYFRRVYSRPESSFALHDPHLVAPGCLYLAAKAEESVAAAKLLLAAMRRLRPAWPYELRDLLDVEMVILEALDARLAVFDAYLPLAAMLESDGALAALGQNAWAALNDAFRTDVAVMHPPQVVALGCLQLASAVCGRDVAPWLKPLGARFGASSPDCWDAVFAVVLELMEMYERRRTPISQQQAAELLRAAGARAGALDADDDGDGGGGGGGGG